MSYIRTYTPAWQADFERLAAFLRGYLPGEVALHHVGSTSIPGMPAKDIIDIDIECPPGTLEHVLRAAGSAGYRHQGDRGVPGREALDPIPASAAAALRPHHLYALTTGAAELHRHLAFRDFLRAHPSQATRLAAAKWAANDAAASRADYIERKAPAYEAMLEHALAWGAARDV